VKPFPGRPLDVTSVHPAAAFASIKPAKIDTRDECEMGPTVVAGDIRIADGVRRGVK
jgi:hypothetical protein